ncbi:MAG: hypothetical protein FWD35_00250 [Oscillospiraceae bacterium]|nr:hypothetical protein [Oscillospiraceae bacterium]
MNIHHHNSAQIAALINTAASALAADKSLEELDTLAILARMFADTLHAIAKIERHHVLLRELQRRDNPP